MARSASWFASAVLPLDRGRVPREVMAGITLAALAVPEVMGYAIIAGMPVITGIFTLLLPAVAFALLGSSRHLVVGADSATAAILAAGLTGIAVQGSAEYVELAGVLALMTAGLLIVARAAQLGFVADFLSRTVLIGFLSGVGIQVACTQIPGMLGVAAGSGGAPAQLWDAVTSLGDVNAATVAVAVAVAAVMCGGPRHAPGVPWAILAVAGAIIASAALDLSARGVSTLGTLPQGLPSLTLPHVPLARIPELAATALSMFVVILAQSAATARAYAAKFDERADEGGDLVGLAAANVGAAVSGSFVVNGSPTKTQMVDVAGGRTQLAQLSSAAAVLLVLVFLTGPLADLPHGALAALVFVIAIRLVDIPGLRDVYRRRPVEFAVAVSTALVVLVAGVQTGLLLAVAMSIVAHLRHSYRPSGRLLAPSGAGAWRTAPLHSGVQAAPGLLLFRFTSSLYYANAQRFDDELTALVAQADPPLRWCCVLCDAMDDIDYSGSLALAAVQRRLEADGVQLVLCGASDPVMAELRRDGLVDRVGEAHCFAWPDEVLDAFLRRDGPAEEGPPTAVPSTDQPR